jgi:hypothetical protein
MQDYKNLELSDLFDILTEKTSEYMKMLSGGASQEQFEACREDIINVQMEIVSRKVVRTNPASKGADNFKAGSPTPPSAGRRRS